MLLESINNALMVLSEYVWSWPLLISFIIVGIGITSALGGVQFRHFLTAWQSLFIKPETATTTQGMTPIQAFINALGNSIGNGSIAGVATAIAAGGPGAAFWMVIAGMLLMAIRYAEVYLGLTIKDSTGGARSLGGPMAYLARIPLAGTVLAYIYACGCFIFGLLGGNAMQCNSMALGLQSVFGVSLTVVGAGLTLFIVYIIIGGAQRILKVSDRLVPFKVGAFLLSALIVFVYYIQNLIPALRIIITAAFNPAAVSGALVGIVVRDAMRKGFTRAINASEAGTGTAAVLYGATGSTNPVRDSIMSMLSVFIGVDIICFFIALLIVMSGAWQTPLTSTPLMIQAYSGVFGAWSSWIVTFCSVSFGMGLLVTYAFICKECWLYLTGGRWNFLFSVLYCATAFIGSVASVDMVWASLELINAGMLVLNMAGVLYLFGLVRTGLASYKTL